MADGSGTGAPRGLHVVSGNTPSPIPERLLVSVAVLGKRLGAQLLEHETAPEGLDIRAVRSCVSDFERDLAARKADILVVELEQLGDAPHETLQRLAAKAGATRSIVVYDFASRHRLGRLAECCAARALQHPVSLEELRHVVLDAAALSGTAEDGAAVANALGGVPPRRFTDAELGRLAEVPTTIECECPNHLASLVASLAAFERYAKNCESESVSDEEMHAWLYRQTARARHIVEQALVRLIEHDGIEI